MIQIMPARTFTIHGRTTGWLVSLLLHGGVLLASVNAFNTLSIVPTNTELFSWDVSIVDAPQPQAASEPAETHVDTSKAPPSQPKPTPPAPALTAQPSPAPVTRQVETKPLVEPVEREIREVVNTVQPTRQVVQVETNPIIPQTALEQAKVVKDAAPVETVMDTQPVTEQSSVTTEVVTKREGVVSGRAIEPTVVVRAETSVAHQPAVQESAASAVAHTPVPAASHADDAKVETEIASRAASEENPVSPAPVQPSSAETPQTASATRETNAQIALAPRSGPATKADHGWLAELLHRRIQELRQYPRVARINGWQGKVVLRVVIRDDGHLHDVLILKSSGFDSLDQAAVEAVRRACPLKLHHELGRPSVVMHVPVSYTLAN